MNGRIQIRIDGIPVPQGSKTIVMPRDRTKRPWLRDANAAKLEPWRDLVKATATDQCRYHPTITGPVKVWLRFTFERPPSHYRAGRNAHRLTDRAPLMPTGHDLGDLDKLTRAIFDGLTDARVWTDDALVVDVRARKVYAGEDELALPAAGVVIVLEALADGPTQTAASVAPSAADAATTVQEALL